MGGMQPNRQSCLDKTQANVNNVVRTFSCSSGWLRLVIESIFAAIIVASFTFIVIISFRQPVKNGPHELDKEKTRCSISKCRVVCHKAPYYGAYDNDIIYAVLEAEVNCKQVRLTLNQPTFYDGTLPINWLNRLHADVHELAINGGNIQHITPHVFIKSFTRRLKSLKFENIKITDWASDMLVGLSDVREIFINNCTISRIYRNALRPVDDTLRSISIKASGFWNPSNLTGSATLSELTTVDFTHNNFKSILGTHSFSTLRSCRFLHLNYSKITAIRLGAFDSLINIEKIYLNGNRLVAVPGGLFLITMSLVNPVPKLDLRDNLWHCSCNSRDLLLLTRKNMLLTYPVCNSPENMHGINLYDFAKYCDMFTNVKLVFKNDTRFLNYFEVQTNSCTTNSACLTDNVTSKGISMILVSPSTEYKCEQTDFEGLGQLMFASDFQSNIMKEFLHWITPSYLTTRSYYATIEVTTTGQDDIGLIWYKDSSPNELYCVSSIPDFLRVYSMRDEDKYTFCSYKLSSGLMEKDKCVYYHLSGYEKKTILYYVNLITYTITALLFLTTGALLIYGVIRYNPTFLKGSKRLLFVKHKKYDFDKKQIFGENNIFVIPNNEENTEIVKRNSIESDKSDYSNISASQSGESQFAQWRLYHHFKNNSISSISTFNLENMFNGQIDNCNKNNLYNSLDTISDRTYMSINNI